MFVSTVDTHLDANSNVRSICIKAKYHYNNVIKELMQNIIKQLLRYMHFTIYHVDN